MSRPPGEAPAPSSTVDIWRVLAFALAVVALGAGIAGMISGHHPVPGLALVLLGLILLLYTALAHYPPIRNWLYRWRMRPRRREVQADLEAFIAELAAFVPAAGRRFEERESTLVAWKNRVIVFLDANIGMKAAEAFVPIATQIPPGMSAQPEEHIASSHASHREALDSYRDGVQRGTLRIKASAQASGEVLPRAYRFAYREPGPGR